MVFCNSTILLESSLTEIEILEQIKMLKGDKTIIIISHDKNCFKYCDKVFEINNN